MQKRITIMSTEGIITQLVDTNSFETDLELLAARHPEWAYVTYEASNFNMVWHEIATVYRRTVSA